jgi:hypothetical protein
LLELFVVVLQEIVKVEGSDTQCCHG